MTFRRQPFLPEAGDFIRYTFTAAFGLMQSIGSLFTLITMLLVLNEPLWVITIFCLHVSIFFSAVVISFFNWRKYRSHYKNLFKRLTCIALSIALLSCGYHPEPIEIVYPYKDYNEIMRVFDVVGRQYRKVNGVASWMTKDIMNFLKH